VRIDPAGMMRGLRGTARRAATAARAHPLRSALLLTALGALPVLLLLTPGFQSNDDAAMRAIVDGSAYGERLPHLVFSNALIGVVLSGLYGLTGGFPWYAAYLYLAHATALAALLYLVLADERPGAGLRSAGLVGILSGFHLWAWVDLQFTSASLLLAASGVLLHLARSDRAASWAIPICGGLMLGISSLIRWRSLQAVVLLAIPLVGWTLRRIPWRRQAVFAGAALAVVLTGSVFQAAYYAGDADRHDYRAYNAVRGGLHGSTGLADTGDPAVLAAVGWSENDLAMFDSWFLTDEDRYDLTALRALDDAIGSSVRSLRSAARVAAGHADAPLEIVRLLLVTALLAAAALSGRRARRMGLATAVWFTLVVGALILFSRLPPRVAVPILGFLALSLLLLPGTSGLLPERGDRLRRGIAVLVIAAGVASVGVGLMAARDRSSAHEHAAHRLEVIARDLPALDPGGLFVSWGVQLPLSAALPLERGPLHELPLVTLGWQQHSPMHRSWLEQHGIDDLYLAIGSREDVYLPLGADRLGTLYLRYLEEHYGFTGLLRPVDRVASLTVYDLAVSFEIDDAGATLVEHRPDGSSTRYPLGGRSIVGTATVTLTPDEATIAGQAADRSETGPVERFLVMQDGTGTALLLPHESRGRFADRLDLDRSLRLGFTTTVPGGGEIRVFALSGDAAAEISR